MWISSPQDSVPLQSSMLGCSRPVRCTSVVTFSWTVATSAARSRSVANQPRPPTPASFTGPPPDGLRAPAARANTRRTSETGLLNTAGVGKVVRVTSAVVTGAIALSG
jgi:hypothetical protein